MSAIKAGERVCLDLRRVERLTPAFANALAMTLLEAKLGRAGRPRGSTGAARLPRRLRRRAGLRRSRACSLPLALAQG